MHGEVTLSGKVYASCIVLLPRSAQLSIVNPYNLVYIAVIYFANNDFILKIIQYNWVYNIAGNLF
jgi:hypothetical protein